MYGSKGVNILSYENKHDSLCVLFTYQGNFLMKFVMLQYENVVHHDLPSHHRHFVILGVALCMLYQYIRQSRKCPCEGRITPALLYLKCSFHVLTLNHLSPSEWPDVSYRGEYRNTNTI